MYFLPGFGDRVGDFINGPYGFSLRSSVDSLVVLGAIKEMILVIATAATCWVATSTETLRLRGIGRE